MSYFIKICGITNQTDLDLVISLPVDGVGFNLYEKSKRFIDLNEASKMSEKLPEHLQVFLIFVNQEKEYISKCLAEIPRAIAQFHGEETPEYCESFGRDYIKAIRVKSDTNIEKINKDFKSAKMLIFDSYDEKEHGGTGKTFDLNLIKDKAEVPYWAAGGIDESNFEDTLRLNNCIGIDVCSSVEDVPGIKDHSKVENLIKKVRSIHVWRIDAR